MKNEKLFNLLACYYAFECKIRNYHWNVECHHFTEYHKYFEEMYDTVAEEIDTIAEQIRKLGEKVPATLNNFIDASKNSGFKDANSEETSKDMIVDLIKDNNKLLDMVKDLKLELDGQREHMGTCILLDDLLKSREKTGWFLSSLSK